MVIVSERGSFRGFSSRNPLGVLSGGRLLHAKLRASDISAKSLRLAIRMLEGANKAFESPYLVEGLRKFEITVRERLVLNEKGRENLVVAGAIKYLVSTVKKNYCIRVI